MVDITVIKGTDVIANSRADINNNFAALKAAVESGQSSTATIVSQMSAKTFVTVGTSAGCDYVCDGVHDGQTILLAIAAALAGSRRLFFRNATYNFDDLTDRLTLDYGNVVWEGESFGGVIFKATASLFQGGSDRNGSYGILTIGKNNTTKISNIILRNIIFDCNNALKTAGLTLRGGSANTGAIGLQNVTLENVIVKNSQQNASDPLEAGMFMISGHTNFGDFGYIDNVTFRNCELGYGYKLGLFILGTNVTKVDWDVCWVHEFQASGIAINDYGSVTTHSDWSVNHCRFERNMIATSINAQAHFRDGTQVGVYNFSVDKTYFGPAVNAGTAQDYALTPYQASETRVTNCFFDRGGSGISIGASIAGTFARTFPIRRMYLEGNTFYQMRSCFDPDSAVHMLIRNNIFYEVQNGPIFGPYSEHFPTIIDDNLIYNCNNASTSPPLEQRMAFRVNGDGFVIKNNYVIDDRLLVDPTEILEGLSSTTGGSLGARTYYVQYTFSNDMGETLVSAEQSFSIAANKLALITFPFALPTGAKNIKIYASTISGSETLQTTISLPNADNTWTEPVTGLVSGAAIPVANTTAAGMLYGIYELQGGGSSKINVYQDNFFYGIQTPIKKDAAYRRITSGNFADLSDAGGDEFSVEKAPYSQGNVTGATVFGVFNGETIKATLTGNITITLSGADYKGQELQLILTQDGTGSRTATWPANFKKAGGALTLTATAAAVDMIRMYWDGTNWNEIARALNIG